MVFAINDREIKLHIANYSVKLETLDGEGTGRSKAYGWPMIRDPQGRIINLNLEFAASSSDDPELVYMWQTCWSMGDMDFATIRFIDPVGNTIEQKMYLVASELKYRRIEHNGTVYTEALKVAFIAAEGQ